MIRNPILTAKMVTQKVNQPSSPIVQLHSWSETPLSIADYKKAALSPSRDVLLLWSQESEAMLMPLRPDSTTQQVSTSTSVLPTPLSSSPEPFNPPSHPEELGSPTSKEYKAFFEASESPGTPFATPLGSHLRTFSSPAAVSHSPFEGHSTETPFHTPSSTPCWTPFKSPASTVTLNLPSAPPSDRKPFPFIANVQSFMWGSFEDKCNGDKLCASLKEVLCIVEHSGLVFHTFLPDRHSKETAQSTPTTLDDSDTGLQKGKWRNWGVTETLDHTNIDQCKPGNTPDSFKRTDACQKNGLISYLQMAELKKCPDGLEMRFLQNYSYPSTADIVSYGIGYGSDAFSCLSEFCESAEICEEESSGGFSRDFPEPIDHVVDCARAKYRFAEVISGPSQSTLGILMRKEGDLGSSQQGNKVVLLCKLFQWGIQWNSAVYLGNDSATKWTSFSVAGERLFGLQECGIVHAWSAKNGKRVAEFDVTQYCGFSSNPPVVRNSEPLNNMNTDSSASDTTIGADINAENIEPCFVHMVVTSDCLLVGVIDSKGIFYLISTDEYKSKYPHSKQHGGAQISINSGKDLKVFSSWAVAGLDISRKNPISDVPDHGWLKASSLDKVGKGSKTTEGVDSEVLSAQKVPFLYSQILSSCSSGFVSRATLTRHGLRQLRFTVDSDMALRKVFLPINQIQDDPIICLNPYSVMWMFPSAKNAQKYTLVQNMLHLPKEASDDTGLTVHDNSGLCHATCWQNTVNGSALGFCSLGFLYFVSATALHVVLPPLFCYDEEERDNSPGRWWFTGVSMEHLSGSYKSILEPENSELEPYPWQTEVLDKALIFDSLQEAEHLALRNGWSLQLVRLRRLQLALDYLRLEDVEEALEALVHVGVAEIGIIRVLFCALELVLNRYGGDNELGQASRLLCCAACFATKLVRRHGLSEWQLRLKQQWHLSSSHSGLSSSAWKKKFVNNSAVEMSRFLVVIRNIQKLLQTKGRRPNVGKEEMFEEGQDAGQTSLPSQGVPEEEMATVLKAESSEEASGQSQETHKSSIESWGLVNLEGESRKIQIVESSSEMLARWKKERLDLSEVVRDALQAGRIPLAIVHLHNLQTQLRSREPHIQDPFAEVKGKGRAIVYELLCKGDIARAMEAVRRLGEDSGSVLREIAFGTISRSLRALVFNELQRLDLLEIRDIQLFETVSHLERGYPNRSFWGTYGAGRQPLLPATSVSDQEGLIHRVLKLSCLIKLDDKFTIDCGEIDGIVLGSWNIETEQGGSDKAVEGTSAGYWAGAAIWVSEWDQQTLNRVLLEQPDFDGEAVSWEAQLEFHIAHHNWDSASDLLECIPMELLQEGELHVRLDCNDSFELFKSKMHRLDKADGQYPWESQDVDAVEIIIPKVKFLVFNLASTCTGWMYKKIEEKLAKDHIFVSSFWQGTKELISLMVRSGLLLGDPEKGSRSSILSNTSGSFSSRTSSEASLLQKDALQAFHELVVRHCVRMSLPNFLQMYLDYHSLALDNVSALMMQAVVGDCHWASWLLLSRIKGCEYDASFANARTISAGNMSPALDAEDFVLMVDDMAEGGGEMMALSTLMYAPLTLQKCLCTGIVNRQDGPSWQCTLENLRPQLQRFPTIWRSLVYACFGQDSPFLAPVSPVKKGLLGYLQWREKLFSSACGDTSILSMAPRWFPKNLQRLLHLAIQGPVGGGKVFLHERHRQPTGLVTNALSWETALQTNIEKELYASSFKEEGIEHHLRKGRPLAAFNYILTSRAHNTSSHGSLIREHVGKFTRGQMHISSEVQAVLGPLTSSEEKLLAGVPPLAITHYDNPVIVAACTSLLELCGLPANMLRIDVAALGRIAEYYKVIDQTELPVSITSPGLQGADRSSSSQGVDIAGSLARAVADEYMQIGVTFLIPKKSDSSGKGSLKERPSKVLQTILYHLEKASLLELPKVHGGGATSSRLSSGLGNVSQLRGYQQQSSERWSLVTTFCHIHQLPLSTVYLTSLARDNDWVSFLAEAQSEACPLDILISVASEEFTDPKLQSHVLTVLKSLQSIWQKSNALGMPGVKVSQADESVNPTSTMPEIFKILAESEHEKQPGKALLARAKDLRWPILAVVASCYADVSPLSCLTAWLEVTAARETSSIKVNDATAHIAVRVGAAVEAINSLPSSSRIVEYRYNRRNPKRRRIVSPDKSSSSSLGVSQLVKEGSVTVSLSPKNNTRASAISNEIEKKLMSLYEGATCPDGLSEEECLSRMVAILCEQQRFFPLLRALELFIPSSSLLPFVRFLQAFSQMRLSEASPQLAAFSIRLKEETQQGHFVQSKNGKNMTWISTVAIAAAEAMLAACPSLYEQRCLLQLLTTADFGDGGTISMQFRRLYWKIQFAEPALKQSSEYLAEGTYIDDEALLMALEKQGKWDDARNWAHQLELSGLQSTGLVHHVTETQAEAMVAEWKEFLWDLPEERVALWGHCQSLFTRHAFLPLRAGMFFLKHAEAVENELPPYELHRMLLLAFHWLSGSTTNSPPVYPLHLLRELETRVWLLAVESEMKSNDERGKTSESVPLPSPNKSSLGVDMTAYNREVSPIDRTANAVSVIDAHLRKLGVMDDTNENGNNPQVRTTDVTSPRASTGVTKAKRRFKAYGQHRRMRGDSPLDGTEKPPSDTEDNSSNLTEDAKKTEDVVPRWDERVADQDFERAVLALLEVGQVSAAKQLQRKLAPTRAPLELLLVDAAQKVASLLKPGVKSSISSSMLHPNVLEHLRSTNIVEDIISATPLQVLDAIIASCREGCGRGLCRRIKAVVQVADFLDMPFEEAYEKQPPQLLQLLSFKAQEALPEAKLLTETHSIPAAAIARILAESFLKGLLAAYRGGYMESNQREEGPAPLLWRPSEFLKWGQLCPSEPELGHALMRLVISGHDIPHACEVELLILAHHFYASSACLDGIDVLVDLAATRVESYISDGDFVSLARLVTGISNFQSLHFVLDILIENEQLDLLLQKRAQVDAVMESSASIRGFRMAVLSTLKHFKPQEMDSFALVYNQFEMKHEMAALLESRARRILEQWLAYHDPERSEELLEMMRYHVEAAEVYASIDAGNKARLNCAEASLVSLQLRMPEEAWLNLTETNARRLLVDQVRFQEALIVAEAYNLNQPAEWVPVLWNQMLRVGWIDQFLYDFISTLPLPSSTLMELGRFYRAEITARGSQLDFSKWLSPANLSLEWARHLSKAFRCLLKYIRDVRLRMQLATITAGFPDVVDVCQRILDKVPDTAGPLILRKGHGGTYLPLM